MPTTAASSGLPTLSEIRAWPVEHLEAGAAWAGGEGDRWFRKAHASYDSCDRCRWEGNGQRAAIDKFRQRRNTASAGEEQQTALAKLFRQAADQIGGAKNSANRMIDEAQAYGFEVHENLTVTFPAEGLTAADAATRANLAAEHQAEIRFSALNLVTTADTFAGKIASGTTLITDMIPGAGSGSGAPATHAANFAPPPLNPPPPSSPAPGGQGGDVGSGTALDDAKSPGPGSSTETPKEELGTKLDDDDKHGKVDEPHGDGPLDDAETPGHTSDAGAENDETGGTKLSDPVAGPVPGVPVMPPQQPSVPTSPVSGGAPKAPSLPSIANPAASAGNSTQVSPAALDKAFPTAASSLANNTPSPTGFATPPPAASSAGNGPVAPMTSPPTASVQQGAPLAGPSAAAPAPAAASPVAPPSTAAGGPATPMGGMLSPLMSSPTGGGVGGAPAPMTTPPATPVTPAGPGTGVSASASPVVPMTPAERVRANIARSTGNTLGRIASDARTLCAALHKATENRQGLRWCVGGRPDGVLLVSTNIGLGWVPNDVKLPAPDGVLSRGQHVFGHGNVPWSLRRDWVGHPVRAVRGFARATGEDVVVLACFADAFDPQFDDVHGVQFDVVTEAQLPTVSILTGDDRLQAVNRALADEIASEGVAALVTKLPSAMGDDDAAPDPAVAAGLWLSVTTSMDVSTDAHLEAWAAFCANQLAASAYYLRRADTVKLARQLYADYAYWRWNLEQLAQDAHRVGSTT